MVITTITEPDQLLGNFLILHVLAQIFVVHNQPNIIVSLTGSSNTIRTHTLSNKITTKKALSQLVLR